MSDESRTNPPETGAGHGPDGARRRRMSMAGLLAAFLAVGLLSFLYWFVFLRGLESTDDAYVAGNQVRVAPQVAGAVREVLVDNTQVVEAGRVLVRLDPTDADLALDAARADFAEMVRSIGSLQAKKNRLKAQIGMKESELLMNRNDYTRRLRLKSGVSVTEEELSRFREQTAIAEAALAAARYELEETERLLGATPLEDQPRVRRSAERLREAWLARQRCEIKSPVSGQVARRTVQVGAQVNPTTPLMMVTPLTDIWVDANFKEGQLVRIRPGQRATVRVDLYDGRVVHRGTVAGLSAGTGSAFSLLPPENATGNWIKVVQRVPVKILLHPEDVVAAPLLLGLSCKVEVEVNEEPGPAPETPVRLTESLDTDMRAINGEIAAIIAENAVGDAGRSEIPGAEISGHGN